MITQYHRPSTLEEATTLAAEPDSVIIGGGTVVNGDTLHRPATAVDLQGLDLSGIEPGDGQVRIGAMTDLAEMAESTSIPGAICDLARRELPSTLRAAATIGGTIGAADPDSQLITGLLAFGASVVVATSGGQTDRPIEAVLARLESGEIITSVTIPTGGHAAAHRTGRTPMDTPIVLAVAHRSADGAIRLALSGVAPTPVVVDPSAIAALDPPADFRGSSEYRVALAEVLARRAIADAGGRS